jgi:broad specificity phosphatase PhoE
MNCLTTIYLVRHGEVEYPLDNQGRRLLYGPNVDLSEKGKVQIKKLGEKFQEKGIILDRIFTSPYKRARQTADILWYFFDNDIDDDVDNIKTVEGLRDTWSPGYVGVLYDEFIKTGGDSYSKPKTENQESLKQVSDRIVGAFINILEGCIGKTIGIVSHGDPLRLLYHFLQDPNTDLLDPKTMRDKDYLEKGEARKVVLDGNMRLVETEVILIDSGGKKGVETKF